MVCAAVLGREQEGARARAAVKTQGGEGARAAAAACSCLQGGEGARAAAACSCSLGGEEARAAVLRCRGESPLELAAVPLGFSDSGTTG